MNTILTDDEIDAAWEGPTPSGHGKSRYDIARAVIAAYEDKLARQEPVMVYHGRCTIDCGEHGHQDVELLKMIPAGTKLYTQPAPQQAVPEQLAPVKGKRHACDDPLCVVCGNGDRP